MTRRLGWALAGVLAMTTAARADFDFAITYDFAGLTGVTPSVAPTAATVPPGVTASDLIRGPGIAPAAADNAFASTNWTGATLDPTKYYQFTITPGHGAPLAFIQLGYTDLRSDLGPTHVEVAVSLDNFATSSTVAAYDLGGAVNGGGESLDLGPVGQPGLQDVFTPATFRIYAWGAPDVGGDYRLESPPPGPGVLPSLQIFGAFAPVPEPESLALIGIGAAALGSFARRRRACGMRPAP